MKTSSTYRIPNFVGTDWELRLLCSTEGVYFSLKFRDNEVGPLCDTDGYASSGYVPLRAWLKPESTFATRLHSRIDFLCRWAQEQDAKRKKVVDAVLLVGGYPC